MRRMTKHDYREPGSLARVLEAAESWVDADSEDDVDYHRRKMRMVKAMESHFLAKGWTPPRKRKQRASVAVESLTLPF